MNERFQRDAYQDLRIRPGFDCSALFKEAKEERIHAVVDLLQQTYTMCERGRQRDEQLRDLRPTYWVITTGTSACTYCRQFEGKHPKSYRLPIHVGCICQITGHQ